MKKFYKMFLYDFKMTLREKEALFWMFIFPVVLMLILGFVFGRSGSIVLRVGVVDEDGSALSKVVVNAFEQIDEGDDAPLDVFFGAEKDELEELEDGNRNGVVVIEEGFSDAITGGRSGKVSLYIDESEITTAEITRQTLSGIVIEISNRMAERATGQQEAPELITVESEGIQGEGFEYVDFMVPGILAMTIMFAGIMGYASEVATYREKGILRRIKASPISLPMFLGSGIASVLVFSLVQAVILLGVGVLAFKVKITGNYIYIAAVVLIGAASFLALGFMISSLAGSSKSAAMAGSAVALPMMFLSGIFFSLNWVPRALAIIAQLLPLYYFGDALREIMINGASLASVWFDLLVMVVFGLVCFLVSVKFFRWE